MAREARLEKREPTHVLTIEVPLHLADDDPGFDVVKDTLHMVLPVSRAAYEGRICGDAQVSIEER